MVSVWENCAKWLIRHPLVRDAILWSIPAITFGLFLRGLLLWYSPMAYWGSDSYSYFSFAYRLLFDGQIALYEKRRYVYPLLMVPIAALPGSPLFWTAWIQHAFGLVSLIPLAYAVRKTLVYWRLWIVPITVLFGGMPLVVWYEHELLGESFFINALLWAFAGWCAWEGRRNRVPFHPGWWWLFYVPFALCVLTKPAGRFFWPGLIIGLILAVSWRSLRWKQAVALLLLLFASWTMGQDKQGARLLYSSSFPLTRLDTPLHAELKAEIAPMVTKARDRIDYYYLEDDDPKNFLLRGLRDPAFPAWAALSQNEDATGRAMKELALEGIVGDPFSYALIAFSRTVGAVNPGMFKDVRFESRYYPDKFREQYDEMIASRGIRGVRLLRCLFNLPRGSEIPDWSVIETQLAPPRADWPAVLLNDYVDGYHSLIRFATMAELRGVRKSIWEIRPSFAGWVGMLGLILAVAIPRLRLTLGVWVLIVGGYAVGVHLVGSSNPRFYAPVWPVVLTVWFIPFDALIQFVRARFGSSRP